MCLQINANGHVSRNMLMMQPRPTIKREVISFDRFTHMFQTKVPNRRRRRRRPRRRRRRRRGRRGRRRRRRRRRRGRRRRLHICKARFILLTPSVSDKYCRRRLPPAAVAAVAESR